MDKKKYMILFVYQVLAITFIFLIVHTKDEAFEIMLDPKYYQAYIQTLFIQIFVILDAMFVLFLALDHDQAFLKPFISYFGRKKIFIYKYIFFSIVIILFFIFISMLYLIIPMVLIELHMIYQPLFMISLALDMFLILNFICIFIKEKHKTLSVIIILTYMLAVMFIFDESRILYYICPVISLTKEANIIEIIYKLCYICIGYCIYVLKSLKEDM